MLDSTLPVLVMTAWSSIKWPLEAMRRGRGISFRSPGKIPAAGNSANANRIAASAPQASRLEAETASSGRNQATFWRRSRDGTGAGVIADRAVGMPNVLITGEHGTGKGSCRTNATRVVGTLDETLVTVNAGGLSEGVSRASSLDM